VGPKRAAVCVMVVDDDEAIRETIAALLEEEGYSVVSAANGTEALGLLQKITPEVILLDLTMPVMSGQQFRSRQLGDPSLAKIPTVVMTAADRVHEKAADMQFAETLSKPIKMQQLLDTVDRYCSREPSPRADRA
jgi:CheY-like chemotaxis protein